MFQITNQNSCSEPIHPFLSMKSLQISSKQPRMMHPFLLFSSIIWELNFDGYWTSPGSVQRCSNSSTNCATGHISRHFREEVLGEPPVRGCKSGGSPVHMWKILKGSVQLTPWIHWSQMVNQHVGHRGTLLLRQLRIIPCSWWTATHQQGCSQSLSWEIWVSPHFAPPKGSQGYTTAPRPSVIQRPTGKIIEDFRGNSGDSLGFYELPSGNLLHSCWENHHF